MSIPGSASPLFFQTAAGAAAGVSLQKSVRFNSGDSAYLNRTPSSAGSNTTWTLSTWVKKTGNDNHIFGAGAGNTPGRFGFGFNSSDKIFAFIIASNSTVFSITTDAVFRDSAGWYHLVLIADTGNSTQADRFKIYVNGVLQSVSGTLMPSSQNTFVNTTAAHTFGRRSYTASDYFNGYLASTILVDGTAKDETDFGAFDDNGVWQAAAYSGSFGTNGFHLFDFANESSVGNDSSGNDNDFTVNNISQASLTTWSNGWSNNLLSGFPATNSFNGTGTGLTIGGSNVKSTWTAPSSLAFTTLSIRGSHDGANIKVNGTDVTSQFSSGLSTVTVTGISSPLTSIDLDNTNGQGNARISAIRIDGELLADATPYPGAGNDVLFDVPTNGSADDDTGAGGEVSGNYATLNPLVKHNTASPVYSNGNLEITDTGQSGYNNAISTIGVSSGKWYVECTNEVGAYNFVGIQSGPVLNGYIGNDASGWGYTAEGYLRHNSSNTAYNSITYGAGDVIGIALDLDSSTKTLTFYKNGTSLGTAYSGSDLDADFYHFGGTLYTTNDKQVWNFGQRAFAYSAPSGFKALCTTNLPTPTIANGRDHFDIKLYTGNGGSSTIAVSGYNFAPNLVWLKGRSDPDKHGLYDTVRGATKLLIPSSANGESTQNGVTAFNSDGFDIGNYAETNGSSRTYVAWAWNVPGSASSNSDGTITSSVTKNADAGISLVTWTGTGSAGTVGHGLGSKPDLIIAKVYGDSSYSDNWPVYSSAFDGTHYAYLNDSRKFTDYADFWNDGTATSTVFPVGSDNSDNTKSLLALCFTSVAGFSQFGTYSGNSDASDGNFVYLPFRPAFLLIKDTTSTGYWYLTDSARNPTNDGTTSYVWANTDGAEQSDYIVDLLSNGFRILTGSGNLNASGRDYIYAAFAENPFSSNGGLAR